MTRGSNFWRQQVVSAGIYFLAGAISLLAVVYPFWPPLSLAGLATPRPEMANAVPLLTAGLVFLALLVLLVEVAGERTSAKLVAVLGVLVAATSALRFLETAIPGPGGFSPVFVPIILAGYVFGARFGFLMGSMTLLASALVTGGVGPWLPYQMLVAGWAGLSAGWLPHLKNPRRELATLLLFSVVWGFLYGLALNLYLWPFATAGMPPATEFQGDLLVRYGAFYLATSLVWDAARAAGNALLMAAVGLPMVRVLTRFRDRFQFNVGFEHHEV